MTLGETVVKGKARKIRRLYHGKVVVGFAGASADAFSLMEKFEAKLEEFRGNVMRSSYELARDWRTDRALRRLESLLAVVDAETSLLISGSGDVIEPDDGIIGIGSGGQYAVAAARALVAHTKMGAAEVVEAALQIAADICVYTNHEIIVETVESDG